MEFYCNLKSFSYSTEGGGGVGGGAEVQGFEKGQKMNILKINVINFY